jgi:hypothetical protein
MTTSDVDMNKKTQSHKCYSFRLLSIKWDQVSKTRLKIVKLLGIVGLLVVMFIVVIVVLITSSGVSEVYGGGVLASAFSGAFFAYVFVRVSELFDRLSKREKLNLDTIVQQEYILNDHLNRMDLNIKIADTLVDLLRDKSRAVYAVGFKYIPIDKQNLPDMKNLDFINDMFNYYVDIEKINDGLDIIIKFSVKLIEEYSNMIVSNTSSEKIKHYYHLNSTALIGMINDSKNLLTVAEKDCVELIAKSRYVHNHRSVWLQLAYTGGRVGHYGAGLKTELPILIKELEQDRDRNTAISKAKIETALGRKTNQ